MEHNMEHLDTAVSEDDHAPGMQQGSSTVQRADTSLLDIPSYLLAPHLKGLAPQHRLALLQSCRALRDLAISSAPALQLSISISEQGRCTYPHAAATAAWAATLHPALHLRLRHTPPQHAPAASNSTVTALPPPAAPALAAAITPQLAPALTSLTLQVCVDCVAAVVLHMLCLHSFKSCQCDSSCSLLAVKG
jgi:hypothetical protein